MGTQFACGTAPQCIRTIDLDFSCRITNDRMKLMAKVPQVEFKPAANPRPDCAGPSLLEQMWATLVDEMDQLMPGGYYHDEAKPDPTVAAMDEERAWAEERARIQGACQGIAVCIALVINPYRPNIDEVRTEAAMRWQDRQANDMGLDEDEDRGNDDA